MQYIHPGNASLVRDKFSPSWSKKRSTSRRKSFRDQNIANNKKGKQKPSFPEMLYQILEDSEKEGTESVVGWEYDGTKFHVNKAKVFNETILPKYSGKKTLFRSFQRQLNIYGFKMTKQSGVYYHALFRRGAPHELNRIRPRIQQKNKMSEKTDTESKGSYKATQLPDTSDDDEATISTNSSRTHQSRPSRSASLDNELSLSTGASKNEKHVFDPFVSPICVAAISPTNNICSTVDVGGGSDFDLFDENLEGIHYCECKGCGCCFSSALQ